MSTEQKDPLSAFTDADLEAELKNTIAGVQALGRELAKRKGTPLTSVCKLCEGSKKISGSLRGRPDADEAECFACKGTGEKVEFFPRYIAGVDFDSLGDLIGAGISCDAGAFVSIRPCAAAYGNKTYLGLYLGDMALGLSLGYDDKTMNIVPRRGSYNPAIYVFDLKKIIYGAESWWGEIESEKDLHNISDMDINNVWYVKALQQLHGQKEETKDPEPEPAPATTAPA